MSLPFLGEDASATRWICIQETSTEPAPIVSRRDTSREYSGKLYRPPYTEGFIPRLLDQEKKPHEIIVFGDKRYFAPFDKKASISQRVRVVGGVIKTRCSTFPCKSDQSLSSIVLVAVNPLDEDLAGVKEIADLKDEVDWEEAVAFMRNSDGDFYIGKKYHPAWRIRGEIPAKQALQMALKKGHLFTFKELKTMQPACHRLYDYLWKSFQKIKMDEKKEQETHFSDFFGDFYETYHRRMNICTKYVSFSNIVDNPKRHWFFTGIDLFFKLEKLGLSYSCAKRAWVKKQTDKNLSARYSKCTKGQIERSFTNGISVLRSLSLTKQNHYRYISYDEGAGASNQKLYSWIFVSNLQLSCSSNRRIQSVFPYDIVFEDYF